MFPLLNCTLNMELTVPRTLFRRAYISILKTACILRHAGMTEMQPHIAGEPNLGGMTAKGRGTHQGWGRLWTAPFASEVKLHACADANRSLHMACQLLTKIKSLGSCSNDE